MSYKDSKRAPSSPLFNTKKRHGDIKARKITDGSKLRSCDRYDKLEGLSPTVATDSIFMTGVVDAMKGRVVAILDIANTFFTQTMI